MPVSCKVFLSFESTRQTHTTCSITPTISSSLHKCYFPKKKNSLEKFLAIHVVYIGKNTKSIFKAAFDWLMEKVKLI